MRGVGLEWWLKGDINLFFLIFYFLSRCIKFATFGIINSEWQECRCLFYNSYYFSLFFSQKLTTKEEIEVKLKKRLNFTKYFFIGRAIISQTICSKSGKEILKHSVIEIIVCFSYMSYFWTVLLNILLQKDEEVEVNTGKLSTFFPYPTLFVVVICQVL